MALERAPSRGGSAGWPAGDHDDVVGLVSVRMSRIAAAVFG